MDKPLTTEEKIIQSAVEIFSQKGYSGTTTKEIAQNAGIAEGTIFRYFPKKKDLLHKILYKVIETVAPNIIGSGLDEIFRDHNGKSDRETIVAFIENRLNLIEKNWPLIKVVMTEAQYHQDIQQLFFKKIVPPIKQMVDRFFEEGIKQGRFKNYNSGVITIMLMGALGSNLLAIKTGVMDEKIMSRREVIEQIADILLTGICKA
ncbi:MAG: TetR/AcrR family transcriptional regulator [Bacillota bacterium]